MRIAGADAETMVVLQVTALYPDVGMGVALQVGAKVATGEMTWG
ncbi:hypothetical protein [Sphingomonas sp. UV9]|nr:hypothetical protein [Sphingomonas sp. UV9]